MSQTPELADELQSSDLVIEGRIMPASNATFFGSIATSAGSAQVVYKPIAGEKPLWDFPDGTLAGREVAAYLVSEAFGWDVVPTTWLRDGPHGPGMVQLWQEIDPDDAAVTLVEEGDVPEGWRHVFDGIDGRDRPVSLVHEDSAELLRMAIFDIVINNADRKGGHVLEMPGGHRYGVDHGIAFHVEHKLRTVLWGWVGEPVPAAYLEVVQRVGSELSGPLGETLAQHLTTEEIAAAATRARRLCDRAVMPAPRGSMPAIPWPPF